MEPYVLEHYRNPNRTGCADSQSLKLLVYEPLSLDFGDAKFLRMSFFSESVRIGPR